MPESGTVLHVLLFTDLVGSTDLKGRVGDAAAARAVSFHDKLFRECLAQFQGLERDDTGDGFFATFEVPSNAVRCALAFHQGLRAPGAPTPLQARVGIHMGEIVEVDSGLSGAGRVKLVGLAVDTAARVMGLAQGGQVLLTRHTFDSVRQQVRAAPDGSAIEWLDHGPYRLKGIEDAINVCEVGVSGLSSLTPPPDSEKAQRAVAPGDEVTLGKRPAVGQRISGRDKWKLERKIGEGGFGEVWVARHDDTREQRAFKFCFEAERLRTLKRELRLFRLIREQLGERQDIARLFEVQFNRAPYYLEMEYTAGGNLADWAAGEGGISQMPLDLRIDLVLQLCGALSAAHSVGVIHRDVKPTNILIQENNDGRLD
ncbi:MAG: protein kinase, partial [Planctomycetota bacterium]|nr:protein kinase [Planctomycetota bacterium]